ncbi:TerC/Alx family metal homeostasis membrane protein [Rhizosphaericola mali]|uniref:TerC/Alx family metal homeostasis membrane protein n=1 Tax=Rhizosphaericola mali TaxID=2545455 RepID=A0A5P2G100_9BACT|nr:TerC/Alx family metal homeostasis membrane protein [Rhizosphaericola mali]QES89484.1 TerC/Alx family metal homeostasis membrane protein [Rhizosphaericola mali]
MTHTQIAYITFGVVLLIALLIDIFVLSKKHHKTTIKEALKQTLFWTVLALAFWVFVWVDEGPVYATKYISAYLMEWSLSIDNIFVFILIFSFFKVSDEDTPNALLFGVLAAIVFRVIFIAIGIGLIQKFSWIMYIFGAILLYTGIKLFFQKEEENYNPNDSKIFKLINKVFTVSHTKPNGRYFIKEDGKRKITTLAVVVLILAFTDIAFALDSIPTVVSLVKGGANQAFKSQDIMVIYSSNIMAVLGLRSLFFLLKGAADKFKYLQQGIAFILVFIGVKMLIEYFHIEISIYVSLIVILASVMTAIFYSLYKEKSTKI